MTAPSPTARAGATANNGAPDAVEFDLFRLDCAVDALRGADLSPHREDLARIAANFADLLEAANVRMAA